MEKDRLVGLDEIVGDPARGIEPLIPMSRSGWYRLVSRGAAPRSVKIGKRSFWRLSDLKLLMEKGSAPR